MTLMESRSVLVIDRPGAISLQDVPAAVTAA